MYMLFVHIAWLMERQVINEYLGVELLPGNVIKEMLSFMGKRRAIEDT